MFKNRIILHYIIVTIFVVAIINTSLADDFVYPKMKRGTTEWKSLTPEQRHQICQIPEEVLATLTTDQLIKAFLDYPYIGIIWAYSNWVDGFNRVFKDFNGLRELLKRKDAAKSVLKYYKEMNPGAYDSSWPEYDKGKFTFRFMYLEMILSKDLIQSQFKPHEIEDLLREGVTKYDQKSDHAELHAKIGLTFTVLPLVKALRLINNNAYQGLLYIEGMEPFLTTGQCGNDDIIINIIQEARNY